ncbi:MAG: PQQ-like beta-propeller repeat protein [Bacteroidales bacterium]|nr:PQQ-like beta-propeller repeat protein [Bacteroidales bacterium]
MKRLGILSGIFLTMLCFETEAQKYDDIYYELPNHTLDQSFGYLQDYQINNPFFANTYIQMAIISEQKMVLTDPLLEIEKSQYWADNALKFFEEFKKYFKENELNTNAEYYENLRIKQAGKTLQNSDIDAFVKQHRTFCQSFKDSTMMAYSAIEKSKSLYNKCLDKFTAICKNYPTENKIVTSYNNELKKELETIKADYNEVVAAFDQYHKIIKAYPIARHRQVIDYKDITNYGIDGLTNCNFYENRFIIWNYGKWVDQINNKLNNEIVQLRKRVTDINDKYTADYERFRASQTATGKSAYYTEADLNNIRKYDSKGLIVSLFEYFENRDKVLAIAADPIMSAMDTSAMRNNLKKRYLYNASNYAGNALKALHNSSDNMKSENLSVFADFIKSKYNGTEGFKNFANEEEAFLKNTMSELASNYGKYEFIIERMHKKQSYSKKTKFANIPLWIIDKSNPSGEQYQTQKICYNAQNKAFFAAGIKSTAQATNGFVAHIGNANETEWLAEIKGAAKISYLQAAGDNCLAVCNKNGSQNCTVFAPNGKELISFDIENGEVKSAAIDEISGCYYFAISTESVCLIAKYTSNGQKAWEKGVATASKNADIVLTANGLIVICNANNKLSAVKLDNAGNILKNNEIADNCSEIKNTYSISATDICVIAQDSSDATLFVRLSTDTADVDFATK